MASEKPSTARTVLTPVLFRVPFLYDEKPGSVAKRVEAGRFGEGYLGGSSVSRANVARWVLAKLAEPGFQSQVVAIGEV